MAGTVQKCGASSHENIGVRDERTQEGCVRKRTADAAQGVLSNSGSSSQRRRMESMVLPSGFSKELLGPLLSKSPKVEKLDLSNLSDLTEEHYELISRCKKLRILELSNPPSPKALRTVLVSCTQLEELTVCDSPPSKDYQFHKLPFLYSLKKLVFEGSGISLQDAIYLIARSPSLAALYLHLEGLEEEGKFDSLPELPRLEYFSVFGLDANTLLQLLQKSPCLTELNAEGDGFSGLQPILDNFPCPDLRILNVSASDFSGTDLKQLAPRCPFLERLICRNIIEEEEESWDGVFTMDPLESLQELDLRGKHLNDRQFIALLSKCPKLRHLKVTDMTEELVGILKRGHSRLSEIVVEKRN